MALGKTNKNGNGGAAVAEKSQDSAEKATAGEVKAKKARQPLVAWGARTPEGELIEKLVWPAGTAMPADYSSAKHLPLARKDFATLADYYEFRADTLERRAKKAREEAAAERSGVGKETKAKQKKLLKLKEGYDKLMEELKAAGVDVSALTKA